MYSPLTEDNPPHYTKRDLNSHVPLQTSPVHAARCGISFLPKLTTVVDAALLVEGTNTSSILVRVYSAFDFP